MMVTGHGNECLMTLGGEQFVTERLESARLSKRLQQFHGRRIVLWFDGYAPYRCAASAMVALQRAKLKFRVPQVPSQ